MSNLSNLSNLSKLSNLSPIFADYDDDITMKKTFYLLLWIAIFAISMGFLESAVVVYLRAIYYPEGFAFPLRTLDPGIAITEVLRESATMIMLITIAVITFKQGISRFAALVFIHRTRFRLVR